MQFFALMCQNVHWVKYFAPVQAAPENREQDYDSNAEEQELS